MKKVLTTYANNTQEARIMRNKAKIAKKRPLQSKTVKVKLFRASSHSPLKIDDTAKDAFSELKRETGAPDKSFIRIDTRQTGILGDREIDVCFDDLLNRYDTVYYSNKMLFILDIKTAKRLVGQTLYHDQLGFWLESPYGIPVNLGPVDRRDS